MILGLLLGILLTVVLTVLLLTYSLSYQGWIAFDQYLSCRLNKFAMADETYSARMWRRRDVPKCTKRVKQIDAFFMKYKKQPDHCLNAYLSELRGSQNHPEYRK